MPFIEFDIKKEIRTKREEDEEYRIEHDLVKKEFDIIREAIKYRKEKNVTQQELEQKTGLKQQSISRIEQLESSPSINKFIKYLDGLDLQLVIKEKDKSEEYIGYNREPSRK